MFRGHPLSFAALAAAALACVPQPTLAVNLTWTAPANAVNPSWNDLRFYAPGQIPTARDTVSAANAGAPVVSAANARAFSIDFGNTGLNIRGRALNLGSPTGASSSSIGGTLAVSGGALNLEYGASLSVDTLTWTGGRLDGFNGAKFTVTGNSTIAGAAEKRLRRFEPSIGAADVTLSFDRQVDWSGSGNLVLGTSAILEIANFGNLIDHGGHRINLQVAPTNALVDVRGSYHLVGGRTVSEARFRNRGVIEVDDAATLNLVNGFYFNPASPRTDSTYDHTSQTLREGLYEISGVGVLGVNLFTSNVDSIRNGIETIAEGASITLTNVARGAVPIRNISTSGSGSRDALQALTTVDGTLHLRGTTNFRPAGDLAGSGRLRIDDRATLSLRPLGRLSSTGLIDTQGVIDARFVTLSGTEARLKVSNLGVVNAPGGVSVVRGARAEVRGAINAPVEVDGGPNLVDSTAFVLGPLGRLNGDVTLRRDAQFRLVDSRITGNVRLIGRTLFEGYGTIRGDLLGSRVGVDLSPTIVVGESPNSSGGRPDATLRINGDFRQVGALSLSFSGRRQGISHDFIEVGGTTLLSGLLDLNFDRALGLVVTDRFDILSSVGTIEGSFDAISSVGVPVGLIALTQITPNGVAVIFAAAPPPVPEPGSVFLLLAGMSGLVLRVRALRRNSASL